MKNLFVSIFCFLTLLSLESCIFGKTVKIGEEFTLKPKESIKIETTGMTITLNEVGREWLANNGGERPYAKISVTYKSNEVNLTLRFGSNAGVGEYEIRMVKANPFGSGDATFVVNNKTNRTSKSETKPRKDAAMTFLAKYNLNVEDEEKESEIKIPDTLSSPPFVHYQLASQSVELDLTLFTGKTLALLTFTLKGKAADGAKFFAHLAVNNESVVGAWLTTDAPVAPGITSIARKPNLKE